MFNYELIVKCEASKLVERGLNGPSFLLPQRQHTGTRRTRPFERVIVKVECREPLYAIAGDRASLASLASECTAVPIGLLKVAANVHFKKHKLMIAVQIR
jgi:hypothetical protein